MQLLTVAGLTRWKIYQQKVKSFLRKATMGTAWRWIHFPFKINSCFYTKNQFWRWSKKRTPRKIAAIVVQSMSTSSVASALILRDQRLAADFHSLHSLPVVLFAERLEETVVISNNNSLGRYEGISYSHRFFWAFRIFSIKTLSGQKDVALCLS